MKKYIVIESLGVLRRLAKVTERGNGDLVVSMFVGLNIGESHTQQVKEFHFSVHRSQKSTQINLIKTTLVSDGDQNFISDENFAFTTGLKSNEGFWLVLAYKYPDLVDPYYDFEKSADFILFPDQFDPASHTLLVGFMVGNLDQEFDVETPDYHFESIRTTHFNLVAACTFITIPANKFGLFKIPKTADPRNSESDGDRLKATLLMRGVTPDICFKRLQFHCQGLILEQLQRWEALMPDLPEANRLALKYAMNEVVDGMIATAQTGENGYVELGPIPYYVILPAYRSIRYSYLFKGSILSSTGYIFD